MNGNGVIRSGYPFGWGAYESTLVRGDGMYVFDQNGKRYLDLCSGLWNMPLGYSERWIKAVVNKQMEQLPFSNLLVFSSDIQTQYAQRLLQWMGDFGCVLYTCSGSETVEAAIKTCRQYQCLRNRPERRPWRSLSGSCWTRNSTSGASSNRRKGRRQGRSRWT